MFALSVLLADGNGRGGGDLRSDNSIVGTWAGDRIVIAGDYADKGKYVPDGITYKGTYDGKEEEYTPNLYDYAENEFYDVSFEVLSAMLDDIEFRNEMNRRLRELHMPEDVMNLLSNEDYEGVVRLYNKLDKQENGKFNPLPPYIKSFAEAMIRWMQ